MNTKHFLHFVTFALTFVVSLTAAGVVKSFRGLPVSEKITQVLTEDIENGFSSRRVEMNSETFLAERTDDYVNASESINTNGLPEDFQMAWQRHMQAWRNHSNFLNESKYSRDFDEDFDENSLRQIDEINRTWWEVVRIARQHGAIIPKSAFY